MINPEHKSLNVLVGKEAYFRMHNIPRNRFLSESKISLVSVWVSVQFHFNSGESGNLFLSSTCPSFPRVHSAGPWRTAPLSNKNLYRLLQCFYSSICWCKVFHWLILQKGLLVRLWNSEYIVVIRKCPKRVMNTWGLDPSLRKSSLATSCIWAYFDSWVKILGPPLSALSNFERLLRSKIWYAHGTCNPKSWNILCEASLVHPS